MSLINNAAETTSASSPKSASTKPNEFPHHTPEKSPKVSPLSTPLQSHSPKPPQNTSNNTLSNKFSFKRTLSQARIECIAPNQKGNFITSLNIDELNGWLLSGQCSGTLNAWKIPNHRPEHSKHSKHKNKNNKVFECRNLIPAEEDGIRHIHTFENNIVCMVGYRRVVSFKNYDKSTKCDWKLGINDIFTYSPFTSPHMFYSTQFQNIIHIFCRSFSSCLRIDLRSQKKEVIPLAQTCKIPLKTNILTVNKNFVIWKTLKSKYNFYISPENAHRNKEKNAYLSNSDNKALKWLSKHTNKSRKYYPPKLVKISVRSLSNFNPIHSRDYFKPLPFNASMFIMDNSSMTMAYVTQLNVIKILKIVPDFNIMQYGIGYAKNKNFTTAVQSQRVINTNKSKKSHSLMDALTLSTGLSYDGSVETQSGDNSNGIGNVDILQGMEQDKGESEGNVSVKVSESMGGNEAKELQSLKGHNGYVLAMAYSESIVLSIATDRKLNVWNGKSGAKIATVSNIPGNFIPAYPYMIQKAKNSSKVFYTADDGIFMAVF